MMVNLNTNLIGLYVGIIFGFGFFLFVFIKYKKAPEFLEIAVIILSCTGVIVGIYLGYIACIIPDIEMGR